MGLIMNSNFARNIEELKSQQQELSRSAVELLGLFCSQHNIIIEKQDRFINLEDVKGRDFSLCISTINDDIDFSGLSFTAEADGYILYLVSSSGCEYPFDGFCISDRFTILETLNEVFNLLY